MFISICSILLMDLNLIFTFSDSHMTIYILPFSICHSWNKWSFMNLRSKDLVPLAIKIFLRVNANNIKETKELEIRAILSYFCTAICYL